MAYIGLELSYGTSSKLSAISGAQLHVTLAHFEKPSIDASLLLAKRMEQLAESAPAPVLLMLAIEQWEVGAVVRVKHTTQLEVLRQSVLGALKDLELKVSAEHGFNPHITIGIQRDITVYVSKISTTGIELCGCPMINRYAFPFPERFHV
jgi:2'-5' RNA ligase